MSVVFRPARREEVSAVVALLADDPLGKGREVSDLDIYLAAFDRMQTEGGNDVIVGLDGTDVVATYQMSLLSGLSLRAATRAQIESVRVSADRRGEGIGRAMFEDAEARARAGGATLMQLTMNAGRTESAAFYENIGFQPTHTGCKRAL